jgi:hypothetical protein
MQPRFRHVADEVMTRLHGRVFVAHNAAFDLAVRGRELRRGAWARARRAAAVYRAAGVGCSPICRAARSITSPLLRHQIEARHRAAGDAVATAHALCACCEIAGEREGMRTWAESRRPRHRPAASSRRPDRRRRPFRFPPTRITSRERRDPCPAAPCSTRTVGRWRVHAIQAGGQQLDGGAMFGVVPKTLWERRLRRRRAIASPGDALPAGRARRRAGADRHGLGEQGDAQVPRHLRHRERGGRGTHGARGWHPGGSGSRRATCRW